MEAKNIEVYKNKTLSQEVQRLERNQQEVKTSFFVWVFPHFLPLLFIKLGLKKDQEVFSSAEDSVAFLGIILII